MGAWRSRAARSAAALIAVLVAGCAAPPVEPPAPPPPRPAPPAPTIMAPVQQRLEPGVIGRNARFLVYLPRAGESFESIAAQLLGDARRAWVIADANDADRLVAGEPLIVPLKPLNPGGVTADRYQTVPILCYHRFGGSAGRMSVTPENFAAQLDWLARNDYRVIRLSQLAGFLQGREALPRRAVVITIDDGYESTHRHALPALRKHGFPATLFAYTDFIGAGDALSWPQLRDLVGSGLIDVQAHSKSHRNLIERVAGEDDQRYRSNVEVEVKVPREVLEKRLAHVVNQFAYPYGDANDIVLDALGRQRYELAVTVNPGGNAFFAQPLMLRRTMIFGDHDLEAFKARLQISRAIAR